MFSSKNAPSGVVEGDDEIAISRDCSEDGRLQVKTGCDPTTPPAAGLIGVADARATEAATSAVAASATSAEIERIPNHHRGGRD